MASLRAFDLSRFTDAQSGGEYESALAEMRAGRKRSHWIWYVCPQIAGLGTSHMSQTYAIRDRDEAVAYLRHPVLSARILEITTAVAEQVQNGARLEWLMGSSIDAAKLVSSLTLFGAVARELSEAEGVLHARLSALAEDVLVAAEAQGHPRCRHTLETLSQ